VTATVTSSAGAQARRGDHRLAAGSGLASKAAAEVRFELQGRPPVAVATFGRDKQLPWVAYASPALPAGSRVQRVVGLDSAGRAIGAETDLFEGMPLCVPRP